ncbi:MAG: hypothetical protein ABI852_05605 [Gemmatimonadaceae bacterium]
MGLFREIWPDEKKSIPGEWQAMQQQTATTNCNNKLQQQTATTNGNNKRQQQTATTNGNNELQQRTATTKTAYQWTRILRILNSIKLRRSFRVDLNIAPTAQFDSY